MGSNMMRTQKLQTLLEGITPNVYYEPPPTVHMEYPCIVYSRGSNSVQHAGNLPYRIDTRYILTAIDEDPDGDIVTKLEMLPMCTYDRHFTVDGLNHDVFTLFYSKEE